ncbi:hypothetical protein [Actinoplanes sp. NPDC049265]|uniref:hypothetical protein n=1 Tax=Actinoplanes sp. NPDC049265 TaxID=3363902 RepID=UPI00372060F9
MSVGDLKREVLVRHLEIWTPGALHKRRAAYVHGGADADGGVLAEAALRVFAEQSDLVRGRELTMVAIGEDTTEVDRRLGTVGVGNPALTVHVVTGGTDARLAATLKAVGAARVPILGFLDATTSGRAPEPDTIAAFAAGKPAEVIVGLAPGAVTDVDGYRSALREAGFPLVAAVELAVGDEPGELLVLATTQGKSLEAFKETLWAVDEFAGVRYRDPGDPERHLIDISLTPHPGPLRRELLAHLATVGAATVTELRTFALTETVYRAADATSVLQKLVSSGAVIRTPPAGRLGGDVEIRSA